MPLLKRSKSRYGRSNLTVVPCQNRETERGRACKISQIRYDHAVSQQLRWEKITGNACTSTCGVVVLLMALTVAPIMLLAGGGNVLPGPAKPRGYSLSEMAKATAFFNTGDHSTDTYPDTPFQILYVPKGGGPQPYLFNVSPGTMFYVPLFYNDDSPPIIGAFPMVEDRQALLMYVYSTEQLGALNMTIVVDGMQTSLGSDYLVGVGNVKLADGDGKQYMVFAAFLTPLSKGSHTVEISGKLNGVALLAAASITPPEIYQFDISYSVIVGEDCRAKKK
jgi:hypothetical protein